MKPVPAAALDPVRQINNPDMVMAVVARHQAEREWLSRHADAGAALDRVTRTETAYFEKVRRLGAYTVPATERDGAFQKLVEARASGTEAAAREAEAAVIAANDRVEAAEARLRNGNPDLMLAYSEWQEARHAFSVLRESEKSISDASDSLTRVLAKRDLVEVGNDEQEN